MSAQAEHTALLAGVTAISTSETPKGGHDWHNINGRDPESLIITRLCLIVDYKRPLIPLFSI